jgi:hypothetical protein
MLSPTSWLKRGGHRYERVTKVLRKHRALTLFYFDEGSAVMASSY